MKTRHNNSKIDKLRYKRTRRKNKMDSDDEYDNFYYPIWYIVEQSGAGYSIKSTKKATQTSEQFLNELINLGWRQEYLEKTFKNMNDSLIKNWPSNLLIKSIFTHIIQQQGYLGTIKDSLVGIGLREDVATELEEILNPLLDSSYTHSQLLEKGIEYILGEYTPLTPPNTTHCIQPDKINIWFKYKHPNSKQIQIYNISQPINNTSHNYETALNTLQPTSSDITYYFHTTSWKSSFDIMEEINRQKGRKCLDFGIFPGFYLATNYHDSINWGYKNMTYWSNEIAIMIFAIPNSLPKSIKYKELIGDEWIYVTKKSRECEDINKEIDRIRNYDLLYGDMVSNPNDVNQHKKIPKTHNPPKQQLVGKTDKAEKFLQRCLVGCVYFQKYNQGK
jgi:hypothetical protein